MRSTGWSRIISVPAGRLSVAYHANDNDDASTDSVKTLWKLFDWYHLRHYISLWTGLVHSVQNVAVRLILRIRRSEHITTALISLYWLRVLERISFKLAVMTYRPVHGTSPSYLQSCFTRVADDIKTTAAVFLLTSSIRSARSSPYSRQADISGFWCHRLERPASPRRIWAVTRGFQMTRYFSVFPFLPRHYHMNQVFIHYCLDSWHLSSLQYLTLFRTR